LFIPFSPFAIPTASAGQLVCISSSTIASSACHGSNTNGL